MFLWNNRATLAVCAALSVLSACSQSNAVPSAATNGASSTASNAVPPQTSPSQATDDATPADTTSILKQDTKHVVIGSTVDPSNGDKGPHSVSIVKADVSPLKKGQLLVCNFANSSGTAGDGTTIELLDATQGSKPKTFAQSSDIKGCSDAFGSSQSDYVYAAGFTSGVLTEFNPKGVEQTTFGSPLQAPFSDVDVANKGMYQAEYAFTSDAKTGAIVSAGINSYASGFYVQVASGFAHSGSGWSTLGPTGVSYYPKKNVLYIADGVTNTVVKFTHPNDLLIKDEIVVTANGKKFKCLHKKTTCGKLILAGSPLNSPIAMTALPNGNMIVANGAAGTKGGNELVELTPAGQVLDTEVIDTGKTPAIFGLAAGGSKDSNTVIYYTDTNDNSVHELEPPG